MLEIQDPITIKSLKWTTILYLLLLTNGNDVLTYA